MQCPSPASHQEAATLRVLDRLFLLSVLVGLLLPVEGRPEPARIPDRGHLDPQLLQGNTLEDSDSTAAYNLSSDVVFPGWKFPAVPRNGPGALARNVTLTPLAGNQVSTWLNFGIQLVGSECLARIEYRIGVDDLFESSTLRTGDVFPGSFLTLNSGPFHVPGGRHTVILRADPENRIRESTESDNVWMGQFVWSPLPLSIGVPVLRPGPSGAGTFTEPNCDGFGVACPTGLAWVVAAASIDFLDDYDLYLYDDYSGPLNGFENRRATSFSSQNGTDFVVGHRSTTPGTVYPGVTRFVNGRNRPYWIDAETSAGRTTTDLSAHWEQQVLLPGSLAHVYEGFFFEGVHYRLQLVNNSGTSDLGFSVYPPDDGGMYGRNDQGQVASGDGVSLVLEFDPAASGWHPVVVYRGTGSGADSSAIYSFYWTSGVAGVGDAPGVRAELSAFPNPMGAATVIRFTTPERGAVRLVVFDALGRRVRSLLDGTEMEAGSHTVSWDGRTDTGVRSAAGMYWIHLDAGPFTRVVRIARID